MPARRCSRCDKNYEPGKGRLHCPVCGNALSFQTTLTGDDPWPDPPLPPLDPNLRAELDQEWAALRDEAVRRGVSVADVLELRDWAA